MKFSLKMLFRIVTAACLYMAALSIVINAVLSAAGGDPPSGFRFFVLLVSISILLCGAGAVIGGLIGILLGRTKQGAMFGAVVAILLLMIASLLMPAVG